MEIEDLLKFIGIEHQRLIEYYGFKDKEIPKYTILIKIMEELGELSQEVLKSENLQREHKLKKGSKIGEEIADVILASLILAKNEGIDIKEALQKKIETITKRDY